MASLFFFFLSFRTTKKVGANQTSTLSAVVVIQSCRVDGDEEVVVIIAAGGGGASVIGRDDDGVFVSGLDTSTKASSTRTPLVDDGPRKSSTGESSPLILPLLAVGGKSAGVGE